jgi:hypothetical protein
MTKWFFKLEYTVGKLIIPPEVMINFEYGGPHEIKVSLRAPTNEEQVTGHVATNAFCTASSAVEPNDRVQDIFMMITVNQIKPADDGWSQSSIGYSLPDGSRIRIPGLAVFPEHFRSFIMYVENELADWAVRTISVLRWRANELGPHNPIKTRGLYWSNDGNFWHPAPTDFKMVSEIQGPIESSNQIREEVETIVRSGGSAPLHHDLFREAWEQRYKNPRSALVIGMAAAELSVKHCISTLVPDAEWLATNLPTPPLIRILIEYLPKLPVRFKLEGKINPPPKNVLDTLKKGVTIRNQLSHAGNTNPSIEDVDEILQAVHDLLWLIDFYSGSEWALEYLRPDTSASSF